MHAVQTRYEVGDGLGNTDEGAGASAREGAVLGKGGCANGARWPAPGLAPSLAPGLAPGLAPSLAPGLAALLGLLMMAGVGGCGPTSSGDGNGNNENQGCPLGTTDCGGQCVDTSSDVSHCGGCNQPCDAGEVCDGTGSCTGECQAGLENCGGTCADLQSNIDHCGECFRACGGGEICVAGECTDGSCSETSSEAQSGALPADIIVVVDNSGSMTDEAASVQDSMNGFVQAIVGSGIDAHVIMISADSTDEQGICVPAPLGSGSCPADENLPTYRHVVQTVASNNSLDLILSTYSQWSSSLRANATRTIAVITDDNSSLSAADFQSQMVALDPSFQGFKFSAIFSPYEVNPMECMSCTMGGGQCQNCDPCCGADSSMGVMCTPLPAEEGTVYRELVQMTGGVEGNLCIQDFQPAFDDMATAVVAESQVACIYNIPEPPGGETIDYGKVNVEFLEYPGANPTLFYYVPGGLADCGPDGGWYYDDPANPTQLLLCPATCTYVQGASEGSLTVKFGCATVVQ